ncbi:class I SAM-dependent methyltransferase [Kiloniella antarctica]|uniref:Class I SAM-dependent methyltransferase n=1 Tax=Kiloniella antarctica TaxID=1550907 RepID=A0ABW5BMU6_9PROT
MSTKTQSGQYGGRKNLTAYVASLLAPSPLGTTNTETPTYTAQDFSTFDHLHSRGRAATQELCEFLSAHPGSNLLDVGCGIGGPARFIAERFVCNVHGIDITEEYCHTAELLNRLCGLDKRIKITPGNALSLPYPDKNFDIVWSQHTSMNIPDKHTFYSEIHRVLKPGGMFLFHDIFSNENIPNEEDRALLLPVPWATKPEHNHLVQGEIVRDILGGLGFHREIWNDLTAETHLWFHNYNANWTPKDPEQKSLPKELGPKLFIGDDFKLRAQNLKQNLADKKLTVIQAVFQRAQ